jgi:hypothetical protein
VDCPPSGFAREIKVSWFVLVQSRGTDAEHTGTVQTRSQPVPPGRTSARDRPPVKFALAGTAGPESDGVVRYG